MQDLPTIPELDITGWSLPNALALAKVSQLAYSWCNITADTTDTQAIFIYTPTYNLLAFRGTDDVKKAIIDAEIDRETIGYGYSVHRGFNRAWTSIEAKVFAALDAAPKLPLVVTGHSLGAALAVRGAFGLARDRNIRARMIYTFGCPRVGDIGFRAAYGTLLLTPQTQMVVNQEDIVPRVPGAFAPYLLDGYRHVAPWRFMSSGNALEASPTLWRLALSDVTGIESEWRTRKQVALLADHGIERYIEELELLSKEVARG